MPRPVTPSAPAPSRAQPVACYTHSQLPAAPPASLSQNHAAACEVNKREMKVMRRILKRAAGCLPGRGPCGQQQAAKQPSSRTPRPLPNAPQPVDLAPLRDAHNLKYKFATRRRSRRQEIELRSGRKAGPVGRWQRNAFVNMPHYCASSTHHLAAPAAPAAPHCRPHHHLSRRMFWGLVQRERKWQQSTKQFNKCRNHVKVLSKTFAAMTTVKPTRISIKLKHTHVQQLVK